MVLGLSGSWACVPCTPLNTEALSQNLLQMGNFPGLCTKQIYLERTTLIFIKSIKEDFKTHLDFDKTKPAYCVHNSTTSIGIASSLAYLLYAEVAQE